MAASTLPPDAVRQFADSLPEAYRQEFDVSASAAHARLASERGSARVKVGAFPSNTAPGTAVCVVADDQPGLLALISAAIVAIGLDVICGEAFTRRRSDGRLEAVDVFWLRHADVEQRKVRVGKQEIQSLEDTLIALLEGRLDARSVSQPPSASPHEVRPQIGLSEALPPSVNTGTVVRFLEAGDGGLATLEVETGDRSGLLHALSHALYEQGVSIVQSEVKTIGARVFDRFSVVELDGLPISPARRLQIQVAVMSAVEPQPTVIRRDSRNGDRAKPAGGG